MYISAQNIDCGYSLERLAEAVRGGFNEYLQSIFWAEWGGSNEYPQSKFWAEIRKIIYTPANPVLLYKSGV